ncbi:MAG: hypothetical protein L0287_38290, partial [Anaerolineae bacterium]|nr:hypothetical protein [Anaerolineae bacterium]
MKVSARVQNSAGQHHVTLRTNDNMHSLAIHPKPAGLFPHFLLNTDEKFSYILCVIICGQKFSQRLINRIQDTITKNP